jgi:hypothetical protein
MDANNHQMMEPYAYPMSDQWHPTEPAYPTEPYILVVDPATRKLCLPMRAVIHTQALMRLDRVPSICMLYLQGRCRQGPACHQLHADPVVVEMLRSEVSQRTSCCPDHGEEVTQPSLVQLSPDVQVIVVDGHRIPSARVATTNGMRRMIMDRRAAGTESIENPVEAVVFRTQVCRLHVQGRCRYAEDCNFIHICRSLTDGEDMELAKMLSAVATSTPLKGARPTFARSAGTPASAFVPPMPPSPMYAAAPRTPLVMSSDHFALENDHSQDTTPPTTPAITTPIQGPWRHEPYSWQCVSPVRH